MSYINQDPDIAPEDKMMFVPFKGKNVVEITRNAWMVDQAQKEGLSSLITGASEQVAGCWCGDTPGMCVDCREDHVNTMMGKVNIGSGEDADMFR